MRHTLPPVGAALALAVVAVSLSPSPPATAATTPALPALVWESCEEDPSAECSLLEVPVDWADPDGPTIELALARRAATDAEERIGSLVVNPGGPGGSGVHAVLNHSHNFSAELRGRFDLVGFDPRGVERSHPIICSTEVLDRVPDPVLTSQADFEEWVAFNTDLREDCRERTGPLYDHADTRNVVHDLEAIRAALGDAGLTYFGVSYGTLIGQQYAEEYPDHVRALALDSVMDHSVGTRQFLSTQAEAAQEAFDEFVAWCETDTGCALHGQDVRALWADLLERADRGELTVPGDPESTVTTFELIRTAFLAFYTPGWAGLAEDLLALSAGAAQAQAYPLPATRGTPSGEAMPFPVPAVLCSDYELPMRNYREWSLLMRLTETRYAPDMRYGTLALLNIAFCLGHEPVNNPQRPVEVEGTPPLLLGNARFDPATGYNWATSVARQIGDEAVLLTYDGWGHGIYGRSDCVTGAFDDYLTDLVTPAPGTHCPAVPPGQEEPLHGEVLPPVPELDLGIPGYSGLLGGEGAPVEAGAQPN